MPWVVTAQLRRGAKRTTSQGFKTKAEAIAYKDRTLKHRPGSNPRVKKWRKK